MRIERTVTKTLLCAVALASLLALPVFAQQTSGNLRGVVKDQNGAAVRGARITITDRTTNTSFAAETTSEGEFRVNNMPAGEYQMKIEAAGFRSLTLNEVRVLLNQTTDVPAQLTAGIQDELVEISAGGTELVQTTTTNLSKAFSARQVVELPQTTITTANDTGSGIYNLALLSPNVSSSGGVGVGTGGSVGGQRPRNNNFVVDGIDNNRKDVSGPSVYISPETVQEFSILTNQFSAEFARSTGGQFITVTKSGANDFHGAGYGFFRNRSLNALDTAQKNAGVVRDDQPGAQRMPRYDYARYGFNIGGPVYLPRFGLGGSQVLSGKDRFFFFTSYEGLQIGNAAAPAGLTAPTAAGVALLDTTPGLSAANLAIFKQ
jgi:Carboxypeptidase regulatory-like domain